MKIINRLTLRYLKENKKRTILTILCISLSVVMISCVGIAFYSGKQFYKDYIEKTDGDYHYVITDNHLKTIDIIKNDDQVKEYYISNTLNLFYKDKDNYKEQFLLKRGNQNYFKNRNLLQYLMEGKLPTKPNEIVITKEYLSKNNINKKIGDKISFKQNLYENVDQKEKTFEFKIVGFMKIFKTNTQFTSTYDAVSFVDLQEGSYFSVFIKDKDLSTQIFDHGTQLKKTIVNENHIEDDLGLLRYNSPYLAIQDIFEENSNSIFLVMYGLIQIILLIIVFLSVFIIYQAFNLSTNDRIQYLGMLSSVGATPKQKKRSVYFEGFLLSIISIPLGIMIAFIGLSMTFAFISQLETIKSMGVSISAKISLEYLLMVIIISLITISISLYLPARRISKISVIDALKKNDEIKVKAKKLKRNFVIKKFFGIHQQLAIKNYKRQGRRSKVIVFSLVVSMAAFIGIFSFGQNMTKQASEAQKLQNFDVNLYISDDKKQVNELTDFLESNEKVDNYYYITWLNMTSKVDTSYLNSSYSYFTDSNNELETCYVGVTDDVIKDICQENNIEYQPDMAFILNINYYDQQGQKKRMFQKEIDNKFIKSLSFVDEDLDNNKKKISIPFDFQSIELINTSQYQLQQSDSLNIIVPIDYVTQIKRTTAGSVICYINASDYKGLVEDLRNENFSPNDFAAMEETSRQMGLIIQIFVYGFVCIMILFTLMNIINMMSASIEKRKKEFAMMLSVGMSPKGLKRMILNESLIYGLKTLLYGFPLSIMLEYYIYIQTYGSSSDIPFHISYFGYLITFMVIMIVMVLTFRVGLRQFEKQNIIETLKDDM